MKVIMKKVLLTVTLFVLTFSSVMFLSNQEAFKAYADSETNIDSYYELDNVYSTYAPSTNYTIQGGMYSDRDGLAIRPKNTTKSNAGIIIPFDEEILVTADTAIVLDVMFYNNQTRTIKLELVDANEAVHTMVNDELAYMAKNNNHVKDLVIGNNSFNNNLSASSGFDTLNPDAAYNQLVVPLTSFGYMVGDTVAIDSLNFYAPGWSTGIYNRYLFMGASVSSDFSGSGSFTTETTWTAGVDSYALYGTASANLDIQLLEAGNLLLDPSVNSSGSGLVQEFVFKFPDALINENGYVETANLSALTLEYLNTTAISFNGHFKLYSTNGDAIANTNYSNLKTHKVTKDGTEANSNAKYFYNNTNTVGYADSFIAYNFDATNNVTSASTESFFCSNGDLPTEISPFLTFSYDSSNTFELTGVSFGTIRVLTSDASVYNVTTDDSDVVTIDAVKGYLGNTVTYKGTADARVLDSVTLNGVDLTGEEITALYSPQGLTVTITGDMFLDVNYEQFTVTFLDDDGLTVLKTETVEYNQAAQAPADPTKAATAAYTYTFAGWDQDFSQVTTDLMVTATYTQTVNQYTVTFVDDDGLTVLKTETVDYNQAAQAPEDPTKAATAAYTYTFAGWDVPFDQVTADVTVTATYTQTVNQYTVIFVDDDGETVLKTETVDYNQAAQAPTDPTKTATAGYTYTFNGWDQDFSQVTTDMTVKATYTQTANQYTVTFLDEDGTVLATEIVDYNQAAPQPENPTKAATGAYTYTFTGWDQDFSKITKDLTVTALYTETLRQYAVTFVNEDGTTVLKTEMVAYNQAAEAPEDPTKEASDIYTYTFVGWDQDFSNITTDLVVTALYSEALNQYTVTFVNADGTVLETQTVEHNQAAQAPTEPTKAATEVYAYTFIGWDVIFDQITNDLTVTAEYRVSLVNTDNLINPGNDTLYVGETWTDAGISFTGELITYTITGTVDTETSGDYLIEYNVHYDGEEITRFYRYVTVVDPSPSVSITLNPDVTTLSVGDEYLDEGAVSSAGTVEAVSTVDTSKAGVYTVTYTVTLNETTYVKTKYIKVEASLTERTSQELTTTLADDRKE